MLQILLHIQVSVILNAGHQLVTEFFSKLWYCYLYLSQRSEYFFHHCRSHQLHQNLLLCVRWVEGVPTSRPLLQTLADVYRVMSSGPTCETHIRLLQVFMNPFLQTLHLKGTMQILGYYIDYKDPFVTYWKINKNVESKANLSGWTFFPKIP